MHESRRNAGRLTWLLVLGVALIAAASCSRKQTETAQAPSTPPAESSSAAPGAATISDAQIAAIVLAANDADVSNGKQAEGKSKNADVQQFAKQMVTDHSAVNDKAKALASKLSLSPEENDTSKGIKSAQDSVRNALKGKSGAGYDKAYVDNEVQFHETVLNAIDQTLIPSAQNAELKQLLTDTRPVVAAHLDHAKQLQAKLGGTATK